MARPIVKWAGGKAKLVTELLARVPGDVRTYAEPFAGGAALFFALSRSVERGRRTLGRAVLSDRNEELMDLYRAVRDRVEDVIAALGRYRYDRDLYYETRALDPRSLSDVDRAARLVFLNRTCFNGLFRVNSAGRFNVPFGRYDNPRILDADALRAASRALARAELVTGDFAEVTSRLSLGDFVYLDPPYVPLTRTASFTDYVAGGFGPADQKRLADELRALRRRGVLAMLSNADTAEARSLYAGLSMTVVSARRNINADPGKRGAVGELIVTTWGPSGVHEGEEPRRRAAAHG